MATFPAATVTRQDHRFPDWARRFAAAFAIAVTVLAGSAAPVTAGPTPQPMATRYQLRQIGWGETMISWLLQHYRVKHPEVSPAVNVAAFQYTLEGDPHRYGIAVSSVSGRMKHKQAVFDLYQMSPALPGRWKRLGTNTLFNNTDITPAMRLGNKHAEWLVSIYLRPRGAVGTRQVASAPATAAPSIARPSVV